MLPIFGLGIVTGILIVVGILRLTMREEPTGCLIVFGGLFLLLLLILIIPQLVTGL
jgi:hypothetical protein